MKIKKKKTRQLDEVIEFKGSDAHLKLTENNDNKTVVYKQFDVVVEAVDDKKLRAVVNSGQEDRHGEILDMRGLDIKKYMQNPVLAYSHDYQKMSVGRCEKLTKTHDGRLIADFVFATDIDGYDLPKILDQLYRKKYQFAFSIGFIPFEMKGNIYTESQMIEFSPVLIGADSQALLEKSLTKKEPGPTKVIKKINHSKKSMKIKKSVKLSTVKELLEQQATNFKNEIDALKLALDKVNPTPVADPNKKDYSDITKEEKLKIFVKGLATNDMSEYREVLKSAGNTTTDSALLPPTEFVAEVLRLEENYGVARKFCTIRRTDRTSITLILGNGDVQIFETAEAGRKQSTKAGYAPSVLTFKKFAAVAPLTDELLEDSAIDVWNDLTARFARAYAQKEDELVFTVATTGLVNVAGTHTITIDGGSIEDITFDDVNKAMYAVPSSSMVNGRFYFNSTVLGVLQRIKDLQGRYILQMGVNGPASGTLWGRPYELTEVLPSLQEDAEETGFIVFGDLKHVVLGERTQLTAKIFDTGSVADPDDQVEDELNLLTQDMQAMRVVKRMNAKAVFPTAFAIIKTGVSAS